MLSVTARQCNFGSKSEISNVKRTQLHWNYEYFNDITVGGQNLDNIPEGWRYGVQGFRCAHVYSAFFTILCCPGTIGLDIASMLFPGANLDVSLMDLYEQMFSIIVAPLKIHRLNHALCHGRCMDAPFMVREYDLWSIIGSASGNPDRERIRPCMLHVSTEDGQEIVYIPEIKHPCSSTMNFRETLVNDQWIIGDEVGPIQSTPQATSTSHP